MSHFPQCLPFTLGSSAILSGESVKVSIHPSIPATSKTLPSLATLPLSLKEILLTLPSFCQHQARSIINN